jgi:hypothetical protein
MMNEGSLRVVAFSPGGGHSDASVVSQEFQSLIVPKQEREQRQQLALAAEMAGGEDRLWVAVFFLGTGTLV